MEALFVSGVILALSQLNQSLITALRSRFLPGSLAPYLSIVTGIGFVFLVRAAGIENISNLLANPYFAVLNGIAVGLVSSGFYDQNKAAIVKSVADSKSNTSVPTELITEAPADTEDNKL